MKRKTTKLSVLHAPEFPPVEPLWDFDWTTKEPEKFRPFKPKYHLTMGSFIIYGLVHGQFVDMVID